MGPSSPALAKSRPAFPQARKEGRPEDSCRNSCGRPCGEEMADCMELDLFSESQRCSP